MHWFANHPAKAGIPCDQILDDAPGFRWHSRRDIVSGEQRTRTTTCPYFLPRFRGRLRHHQADQRGQVPVRPYHVHLRQLRPGSPEPEFFTTIASSPAYDAEATSHQRRPHGVHEHTSWRFGLCTDAMSSITPAWLRRRAFFSRMVSVDPVSPPNAGGGGQIHLSPFSRHGGTHLHGAFCRERRRKQRGQKQANWAPFFHPDGERVLFSSNHKTCRFPFNIFMVNLDGLGAGDVREAFDSFPMFSPDGTQLAFSSNRNNGRTRNTNLFVADWVD